MTTQPNNADQPIADERCAACGWEGRVADNPDKCPECASEDVWPIADGGWPKKDGTDQPIAAAEPEKCECECGVRFSAPNRCPLYGTAPHFKGVADAQRARAEKAEQEIAWRDKELPDCVCPLCGFTLNGIEWRDYAQMFPDERGQVAHDFCVEVHHRKKAEQERDTANASVKRRDEAMTELMQEATALRAQFAKLSAAVTVVPFHPDDGFPLSDGFMVGKNEGKSTLYPTAEEALVAIVDQLAQARAKRDAAQEEVRQLRTKLDSERAANSANIAELLRADSMVGDLRAEVQRLTESVEATRAELAAKAEQERDAAQEEVRQLRATLEKIGHSEGCPKSHRCHYDNCEVRDAACECGLDAALAPKGTR